MLLVLIGFVASATGCYRRVVSTSGIGTRAVNTEEGYQEAWPIDPVVKELESAGSSSRKQRGPTGRSGRPVFQGSTDR